MHAVDCNKQQGGVVRPPAGSFWSSAATQANTRVSNMEVFLIFLHAAIRLVFLSGSLHLHEDSGAFIHLRKLGIKDHE